MTDLTDIITIGTAIISSHAIATALTASQEYSSLTQTRPNMSRKSKLKRAVTKTIFKEQTAVYSGILISTAMFTYLCTTALNYK